MLNWHKDINGVEWGEFPELTKLGVIHGFSTRLGGVSEGTCKSLNLGLLADPDYPDRTLENRRRLFQAVGLSMDHLASFRQIHSDRVESVDRPGIHDEGADGTVTDSDDVVLLVLAADCVPVLIVDSCTQAFGVIHSGWRGTAEKIVVKAIEKLIQCYGSKVEDIWVGIGPSIGECCYEVSSEVYDQTWASTGTGKKSGESNPHLDLWAVIRGQVIEYGVKAGQILLAGNCTRCESGRFFSHRAGDGGRCGLIAGKK